MRRTIGIAATLVLAIVALAAFGPFGSSDPGYLVRAYFDSGGFVVKGEDVRIAGAIVGSIDSVDVSMPGEAVHSNGSDDPGKAVVVMRITDPGFTDFRQDASCLIRPQSLLGEKYIDCTPTQPRAAGSKPPPRLHVIGDGKPGAGQAFLPLENNGKQVDLDIVQDTLRLPYAQRFRLILNDLGAGLGARGKDLEAIVRRADPALRETDQVLGILASQNHALAKLADDSEAILAPLARERTHVTGFLRGAGDTAAATAERGAQLQEGLSKLPRFFNQLDTTMISLKGFSDQAEPVIGTLGDAAPALTRLTRKLAPFSAAGETALKSLGDAAQKSTANLVASDPVVRQLRDLSRITVSPARNLRKLLSSLNKTKGFQHLLDFIFYSAGSVNGFDQYGHFLRSELVSSNCVDYDIVPFSGCGADFASSAKAAHKSITGKPLPGASRPNAAGAKASGPGQASAKALAGARHLLDFLIGPGPAPAGPATGGGVAGAPGSGSETTTSTTTTTTTTTTTPGYSTGPDPRGVGK